MGDEAEDISGQVRLGAEWGGLLQSLMVKYHDLPWRRVSNRHKTTTWGIRNSNITEQMRLVA